MFIFVSCLDTSALAANCPSVERACIIIQLTQEGKSQRQIGSLLGVEHRTIGRDLADGANAPKNSQSSKENVEKTGANAPNPITLNRLQSLTGEIEWYTPQKYVESVRKVLGIIDLDPASSEIAQQIVKAKKIYTQEQDGLKFPWVGKVFLNPPYAMPTVKQFVVYMVEEFKVGRLKEGILLTNAATDTSWYDIAYGYAEAKCDTTGRISFLGNVQGEFHECTAPACGQTFFYFGLNQQKFAAEFRQYGRIGVELK